MTRPNRDIALIYHYDLAQALEGIPTDWQAIPVNLQAGREGGDLCRLADDFGLRRDLFLMPTPKEVTPSTTTSISSTDDSTSDGLTTTLAFTDLASTLTKTAATIPTVQSNTFELSQTDPTNDFFITVDDGRRGLVTIKCSRTQLRDSLKKLAAAGHEQVIRREWPQEVPPLTDTSHTVEQLTQLFHMVRRVETEVSAPFDPEPQIAAAEVSCPTPSAAAPTPPDDGAFLDPPEIEALKQRMLALPDTRHIQLADISKEANAAGRPISVTQKPCVRRWEIARALILWAEGDSDIYALGNRAIEVATAEQCRTAMDTENFGALISQFTIEQAIKLADYFYPITAKEQQPL